MHLLIPFQGNSHNYSNDSNLKKNNNKILIEEEENKVLTSLDSWVIGGSDELDAHTHLAESY